MKHLIQLALAAILLAACTSPAAHQEYTLSGTAEAPGIEGAKIMLYAITKGTEPMPLDSAVVRNGAFRINGIAPVEPAMVLLSVIDPREGNTGLESNLILEAGNISVNIDTNYLISVHGAPLNDMYHTCHNAVLAYQDTCSAIASLHCPPAERRAIMQRAASHRNSVMVNALLPYINYEVTRNIVYSYYTVFSAGELALLYSHIRNKHDDIVIDFNHSIREAVIGRKPDNVTIPDTVGNQVCLNDIFSRHDYTLVDFWASWCGPCMRNMIDVKQLYDRYHGDRFEVIGVSLDSEREKWLHAVRNINGGWVDLSDLSGWNCSLASRLKVTFVPTTILFDRNGVIVSRNPTHSELEIYLAQ